MLDLGHKVEWEREAKQKQVEWLSGRRCVNQETGEVVSKPDGTPCTLADCSRSWYVGAGVDRNVRVVARRSARAAKHPADVTVFRPKLITLTFRDVKESWEIKGAVSKFTNTLMHWAKRNGGESPAYFWVDEVQMKTERGAAHFHVLVLGVPFLAKSLIESWWAHGFVDVRAVDNAGRGLSYLAKYMWKWADVDVKLESLPDWWFYYSIFHKRRFGFSRWFAFAPAERIPVWLKETLEGMKMLDGLSRASRMVGGGWLCEVAGSPLCEGGIELRMRSPWVVVRV